MDAARVGFRADAEDDVDWNGLELQLESQAATAARGLASQYGGTVNQYVHRDLERVLRIQLARETPETRAALERWRRVNVDLITSIPRRHLADIRELVRKAQETGMRAETLSRLIREREEVSESRADLIARDQILKASASLTQVRHEEAGITEYEWSTSRDERVRGNPSGKYPDSEENHFRLEGQRFRWNDPPDLGNGERANPGESIQCRCVAIPILPE